LKGATKNLAFLLDSYALPDGVGIPATVRVDAGTVLPAGNGAYWLNSLGSAATPSLPLVTVVTVTVLVAVLAPACVVAVIIAVPTPTGVTTKRVCVSMITHGRAVENTWRIIRLKYRSSCGHRIALWSNPGRD